MCKCSKSASSAAITLPRHLALDPRRPPAVTLASLGVYFRCVFGSHWLLLAAAGADADAHFRIPATSGTIRHARRAALADDTNGVTATTAAEQYGRFVQDSAAFTTTTTATTNA